MVTMYLPPFEYWPVWPCLTLLVIFIPVSVWHQHHWNRTVAEYAELRREAGAPDETWPPSELKWVLSVQPGLLFAVSALLIVMLGFGFGALIAWPHRLFPWMNILNYYDRPYLATMLVAGSAALVGALALAIDLSRSEWRGVARQVRRAVHAPRRARQERFAAALMIDPGLERAES